MGQHCDTCANWITRRTSVYADGSQVINWEAPDGKGNCLVIAAEVPATFGCHAHIPDWNGTEHAVISRKEGLPWTNWHYGPCPDCNGRGSIEGAQMYCMRCAGTTQVRFYDDGYIGEELTRLHPEEKKRIEAEAKLKRRKALEEQLAKLDSEDAECTEQSEKMLLTEPSPIAGRSKAIRERLITQRPEDQGFL